MRSNRRAMRRAISPSLMAAKAGKHVHMEKPGGTVLSDFEKLIETVSYLIENKPKLEKMSNAAQKSSIIDANERIYEALMRLYTKV